MVAFGAARSIFFLSVVSEAYSLLVCTVINGVAEFRAMVHSSMAHFQNQRKVACRGCPRHADVVVPINGTRGGSVSAGTASGVAAAQTGEKPAQRISEPRGEIPARNDRGTQRAALPEGSERALVAAGRLAADEGDHVRLTGDLSHLVDMRLHDLHRLSQLIVSCRSLGVLCHFGTILSFFSASRPRFTSSTF